MSIREIAAQIVLIPFMAVTWVFWKGWKVTYGILCVPRKLLDLAIRIFRGAPVVVENPIRPAVVVQIPTEPQTPIVKPDTPPTEPGQPDFVSPVSSDSPPIVESPQGEPDIVESVEVTNLEAAPGLIQQAQTAQKPTFLAYIFGWRE